MNDYFDFDCNWNNYLDYICNESPTCTYKFPTVDQSQTFILKLLMLRDVLKDFQLTDKHIVDDE